VSAAPPPAAPHTMGPRPIDLRAGIGEVVRSVEGAALAEAERAARSRGVNVFVIRPEHNPIGPFAFAGVYDESSDRTRSLGELMQQGFADAYRQFIEPVVAAGERGEPA